MFDVLAVSQDLEENKRIKCDSYTCAVQKLKHEVDKSTYCGFPKHSQVAQLADLASGLQ